MSKYSTGERMYRLLQQGRALTIDGLPRNQNLINFSMFNDLSHPLLFRSFSIKFVLDGCERYTVNGNYYSVKKGQYLLANPYCSGTVEIDSDKLVKGICIDVAPQMLSEVLASSIRADTSFPDIALDTFFTGPDFLENKYDAGRTQLGSMLAEVGRILDRDPAADHTFSNEFYYTLAEKIVEDHRQVWGQIYRIHTVKRQTRKDLYRKLLIGREYLDAHFSEKLIVRTAAAEAALSEYYFFRLFKTAFSISPQQYVIRKRLTTASELLRKGSYSVADVAIAVGFSDTQSFSKAFKRHFGTTPSGR